MSNLKGMIVLQIEECRMALNTNEVEILITRLSTLDTLMKSFITPYINRISKLNAEEKKMVETYQGSLKEFELAKAMRINWNSRYADEQLRQKMFRCHELFSSIMEFAVHEKILGYDESSKTESVWAVKPTKK